MTPRKFWTMCRIHDWTYMYSDDPEVYANGVKSLNDLLRIADKGPEFEEVYNAWENYHFHCGPKPDEPKET